MAGKFDPTTELRVNWQGNSPQDILVEIPAGPWLDDLAELLPFLIDMEDPDDYSGDPEALIASETIKQVMEWCASIRDGVADGPERNREEG